MQAINILVKSVNILQLVKEPIRRIWCDNQPQAILELPIHPTTLSFDNCQKFMNPDVVHQHGATCHTVRKTINLLKES